MKKRTLTMIMVVAIVLFAFIWVFLPCTQVADAVVPNNYKQDVIDNGYDWQMNDDQLDIARLKEIVASWFVNPIFDFDDIKPVVVAVIDTGINENHEIFLGRYDENGVENPLQQMGEYDVLYRDSDGNVIGKNCVLAEDRDFGVKDSNFKDDDNNRHGTHVAGIIATFIHELNLEKYIKIMPIKAAYTRGASSYFTTGATDDAVNFAISNGADVVNMSFSSTTPYIGRTIEGTIAESAVFVAAAGNDGKNVVTYPASKKHVIGVMNYMQNDDGSLSLSSTSNHGSHFDICAPGTDIFSADGKYPSKYKKLSGTSMASPIVAFAGALLTLKHRALQSETGVVKKPVEIAQMIVDGATKTITKSGKQYPVLNLCSLAEGEEVMFAKIDTSASLNQKLGLLEPIEFHLTLYPYKHEVGTVEWYVNGVLAGNGFDFEYTPQSEVGQYEIEALWYDEGAHGVVERTANCVVNIDYFQLDVETVRSLEMSIANEDGNVLESENIHWRVGNKLFMDFSSIPIQSIDPDTSIIWLVNGEIVSNGTEFEFVPKEKGEYLVQAKINGVYTKAKIINVDNISEDLEHKLIVASIVISSVVGAVAIVLIVVVIARRAKLKQGKI